MRVITGILVVIGIIAVVRITSGWFLGHLVSAATASNAPGCLEVLGNTTSEEEGRTYIVGSIRNSCDRDYGNVTLSFRVDRSSGPLGDMAEAVAYAYSRNVKARSTREFKTAVTISKNATYRFDGVNAY
jgi:hypothetical protein